MIYNAYNFLFRFSFFHLEYQPTTGRGLTNLLAKHYRNQALFQLHTIIFGLDALGNPVSVVRGVVEGAVDLFYEPIKVKKTFNLRFSINFIVNECMLVTCTHPHAGKCFGTTRIP